MSGIAIFNKAVSTLQDSQKNLMAISQARKKLEQEDEIFGIKKKQAELDLERAVKEGKMTDLEAEIRSSQHKAFIQQEKDKMKGQLAMVRQAEHENASVADKAMQWAKIGYKSDPQGVLAWLGAIDRNKARKTELRQKMSYGRMGFEEVDVAEEDTSDAQTTKPIAEKDVANLAVRMAEPTGEDPEEYMEKARRMLTGGVKSAVQDNAEVVQPKKPQQVKQPETKASSKYKAGEQRVIKGNTYIRNENGQWIPKS